MSDEEEALDAYFTAVKKGNLQKAKDQINDLYMLHFDLDSVPYPHQYTLMTFAVKYNRLEIVKYLLEKSADIDVQDNLYTPLAVSCVTENLSMLQKLLEFGADPNMKFQQDENEYVALHVALSKKNLDLVKALVEGGTELNDTSMVLPLVQAIKEGDNDIINYLLDKGADVNARSTVEQEPSNEIYEYPPILAAISKKNEVILKKLIQLGADTNASYQGYSALVMALKSTPDMVRVLCENGANVNFKHPISGNTPLLRAIKNRPISVSMIKILCEFGADKRMTNKFNESAISAAQNIEDEDLMDEVLAILKWCGISDPALVAQSNQGSNSANEPGGLQKNVEDFNVQLLNAIRKGDLKSMKQLIGYGADVTANDYQAIAEAISTGNLEIIKYLFSISGLILDKKDSRKDLLVKFLTAAGNNLDIFKYIEKRSGSNVKNVIYDVTQYDILKLNNKTVSYILVHYIQGLKYSEVISLMFAAFRADNKRSFENLLDYLSFDKLTAEEKTSLGELVKKLANQGNLRMLKEFQRKGFNFTFIGDDLWKLVYRRWVDIEKFLEDLGLAKPNSLGEKGNENNAPYGGRRRTRKSRVTRRKLSNRSRKH